MKRIEIVVVLVVLVLCGCWLVPEDTLVPDENSGLVRIRIENPRVQHASSESAGIPIDTETIGLRISGVTPVVRVESFEGDSYIEFALILPAPSTVDFHLIGANTNKILTCYAMKTGVEISPGVSNEIVIEMQTYEHSFSVELRTERHTFAEPQYFDDNPRQVIWARLNVELGFSGNHFGDFYSTFFYPSTLQLLQIEYTLDIWNGKSFWLNSSWSETPAGGTYYLMLVSENSIIAGLNRSYQIFWLFIPIAYADTGDPYHFTEGSISVSIPIRWAAFNHMEAGLELPEAINMMDFLSETVIIVE